MGDGICLRLVLHLLSSSTSIFDDTGLLEDVYLLALVQSRTISQNRSQGHGFESPGFTTKRTT